MTIPELEKLLADYERQYTRFEAMKPTERDKLARVMMEWEKLTAAIREEIRLRKREAMN